MSATESSKRLKGAAVEFQWEPYENLLGVSTEDDVAELINHICKEILLRDEIALL